MSISRSSLLFYGMVLGIFCLTSTRAFLFSTLPNRLGCFSSTASTSVSTTGKRFISPKGLSSLSVAQEYCSISNIATSQSRQIRRMATTGGEDSEESSSSVPDGYKIDLTGKVAFIAGVADANGYGWAIAKALAEAGAKIIVGTWPPVLGIFKAQLDGGRLAEDLKTSTGGKWEIEKIYPLDAVFDSPEDVPEEIKTNKRYAGLAGYTIEEVAKEVEKDYGKIDILIHSLANGPEVTKPLLETTRKGYLAASSASAYSMVGMMQKFGPIMNKGGSVVSLTYIASENVIPGYGGGMSSAKAQLESDTRTLAFEAGQKWGLRVNTISAGPLKSRAASAIGKEAGKRTFIEYAIDYSKANAPLAQDLYSDDVGTSALYLSSSMARCVTGITMYVDNGLHAMGMALDSKSMQDEEVKTADSKTVENA